MQKDKKLSVSLSDKEATRFLWHLIADAWDMLNCDALLRSGDQHFDGAVIEEVPAPQQIPADLLIDKHDYYNETMSDDARTICVFVCLMDINEQLKVLGAKRKASRLLIERFFRRKWGRLRVKQAVNEIKKLIEI